MKLPGGERAHVSLDRLTHYLLNPQHGSGKHKARVFAAALGLDATASQALHDWLVEIAQTGEAEAGRSDEHGQRFVIRAKFVYNGKEAQVRTAWIVRSSGAPPEFLTAFVE